MILFIFLWFFIISTTDQLDNSERLHEPAFANVLSAQLNLSKTIFHEYDNELSPIPEEFNDLTNGTWWYNLTLARLKLIDVDEPKEQFTVVMQLVQEWPDWRLKWDKDDYANVSALHVRLDKVWSPPFIAFGASEVVEHRDQNTRMVKVLHNGTVRAFIPMRITSNCKLDLTSFPFDIQECKIRMGLPVFNSALYNMDINIPDAFQSLSIFSLMSNSVWQVFYIEVDTEHIKSNDPLYDAKMCYVKLYLRRNSPFYLYMIVLPTFIINAISIGGVFMKNTNKIDRLTIGLTHIMTMTFILALIVDKLPKTEVIPLLGKYVIFGLSTMIFALLVSSYLKNFCSYFSEKMGRSEWVVLRKLSRFFGSPLRFTMLALFQVSNILAALFLGFVHYIYEGTFKELTTSDTIT